jgi:hypothetical protein
MQLDECLVDIEKNPTDVKKLEKNQIIQLLKNAQTILKQEPTFLKIKGNIAFAGDTHGDFDTTQAIIKKFIDNDHLVFLGDYIDREPQQWESIYNLFYLITLKVLHPNKIILLRGNHEGNYLITCHPYELKRELLQKYEDTLIHDYVEKVFSELPLMILANNTIFASHGGIIKNATVPHLQSINKNDKKAVLSLTWSDPEDSPTFRGIGEPFSKKDLLRFLTKIKATVFIRAHDYHTNGISLYDNKCLTIFSSKRYKSMGNKGILVAKIQKQRTIQSVDDVTVYDYSSGSWKSYQVLKK